MAWLHRQEQFSPEMLKEEEVRNFIRETATLLDGAVDYSIRTVTICNTGLRVTSGYVRVISCWKGLRSRLPAGSGTGISRPTVSAADAWYSR